MAVSPIGGWPRKSTAMAPAATGAEHRLSLRVKSASGGARPPRLHRAASAATIQHWRKPIRPALTAVTSFGLRKVSRGDQKK